MSHSQGRDTAAAGPTLLGLAVPDVSAALGGVV